ncbi:bacteriophage T4 gp5 trimerisation domain-containing protein, partial [Buttiauxella sp.]|uniref:bacteriophage T4 gp5 trimerisation domain-containing protein n=1 Tax=Buttiauxella sp. TaxID=1972222 RepID=UPI003C778E6D
VGQEVIVDFLNGDPDQPIITGRTYHAANRAPGDLPGTKTQMAIRSQTYKGNGYNELMFEDQTGQELLSMHAQKDMKTVVLNSQFYNVQRDREKCIGNDQRLSVGRDDTIVVERDRHTTIKGGWHLDVKTHREEYSQANFHNEIAGDYSRLTEGKETILTGKENTTQAKKIILKGNEKIDIYGPMGRITIDDKGITLDAPVINLCGIVKITPPTANVLAKMNNAGQSFTDSEINQSAFTENTENTESQPPENDNPNSDIPPPQDDGDDEDENAPYQLRFQLTDDEHKPFITKNYIAFLKDGSTTSSTTDSQGYTEIFQAEEVENIHIDVILDNNQKDIL